MKRSGVCLAKNVYEILSKLPKHGVGSRIQRKTWKDDSFWDVSQVKMHVSGKAGKAYGMLTWRGEQVHEVPKQIPGTLKKVWRVVSSSSEGPGVTWPSLDKALLDSVGQSQEETSSSS
ncbi:hypothetical protein M9434_001544 [Picochlorum sp. BPE23]|nr:hypothetical protein M9434_001544 [Picochlorum sp. BPE23]